MIEALRPPALPVTGPVLVVGTGLLGASVALALRRAGVAVLLDDADRSVLAEAVAVGAGQPLRIGDEALDTGPPDPAPVVVVVAVPPAVAGEVMARAAASWPTAVVTDVTSVKEQPLRRALELGADAARLVGGHPLAGREVSGPAAARADLLDDRPWVLTPVEGARPESVAVVRDLVLTCGGVPMPLAPADHDRAVALTSHGPQILASLVAARLAETDPALVEVSGQGLRDVTRIAGSDPSLWVEILGANAGPVADVLDGVRADLDRVTGALRHWSGDSAGAAEVIRDALRRGNAGRARVPGKHGAAATAYDIVPVKVADQPGELARLFVAAGDAGVNLEDVRIEHVLGRPSGLVDLSVRTGTGAGLAAALRQRGFDVRW